jgi:hypothetical protein
MERNWNGATLEYLGGREKPEARPEDTQSNLKLGLKILNLESED